MTSVHIVISFVVNSKERCCKYATEEFGVRTDAPARTGASVEAPVDIHFPFCTTLPSKREHDMVSAVVPVEISSEHDMAIVSVEIS